MPRHFANAVVTLLQGFESDSQRFILNQLGTGHGELKDITWFGWDTFCSVYSVSMRFSENLWFHLLR